MLDDTVTAMGARALRHFLEAPLLDINQIKKRQDAVEVLVNDNILRDDIRNALKSVYDMERLVSKVVSGSVTPRELVSLKNSLKNLPTLKNILARTINETKNVYLYELYNSLDTLKDIYELIDKSIVEDAPIALKDGGIIKEGYNQDVDEYKKASTQGQDWLMELEAKEKERTGIKGKWLRVGYNRVFGYYIEVTNSYKNMVPEDRYIRKQTLAGAERYITEELKQIEDKILGAQEKLTDLEYNLFCEVRENVAKQVIRIQSSANVISTLDVIASFAKVAVDNNYVKPELVTTGEIEIKCESLEVLSPNMLSKDSIRNAVVSNSILFSLLGKGSRRLRIP